MGTVVSLRRGVETVDEGGPAWRGDGGKPNALLELLADLASPGASVIAARGGQGGRGNAALRSRQDRSAPSVAEAFWRCMHELALGTDKSGGVLADQLCETGSKGSLARKTCCSWN